MSELDRKLYELLGDKTLSFGCVLENVCEFHIKFSSHYGTEGGFRTDDGGLENMEMMKIIGHEPTIADLHRMFASLKIRFEQDNNFIRTDDFLPTIIGYDCTRNLLSQSEETKLSLINLITSHS